MKDSFASLLSALLAEIFDSEECPQTIQNKAESLWQEIESRAFRSPEFVRAALPIALSEIEWDGKPSFDLAQVVNAVDRNYFPDSEFP